MRIHTLIFSLVIATAVGLGSLAAQAPKAAPSATAPTATPSATPAPTQQTPVFQKVEPPSPNDPKPAVVKPDGTKANTGEKPQPVNVKETQPNGGTTAPPSENPTLSAPVPPPQDVATPPIRYFALIFGSQSSPKRARFSHTWYTIVKATPKQSLPSDYDPNGDQIKYYDVLAHTISWLPRTLNVRVLKLRAEPGVNLALHPTINYARCNGECVAMWGPYEVNPLVAEELYNKSIKQIARLNSGCVLYKAIDPDSGPRANYIFDCIHAVSDLDGPGRRSAYDEFQRYGFDASQHLAQVMARANRIDTTVVHEWVAEALDLNRCSIQRRTIGPCGPQMQTPAVVKAPPQAVYRR